MPTTTFSFLVLGGKATQGPLQGCAESGHGHRPVEGRWEQGGPVSTLPLPDPPCQDPLKSLPSSPHHTETARLTTTTT